MLLSLPVSCLPQCTPLLLDPALSPAPHCWPLSFSLLVSSHFGSFCLFFLLLHVLVSNNCHLLASRCASSNQIIFIVVISPHLFSSLLLVIVICCLVSSGLFSSKFIFSNLSLLFLFCWLLSCPFSNNCHRVVFLLISSVYCFGLFFSHHPFQCFTFLH